MGGGCLEPTLCAHLKSFWELKRLIRSPAASDPFVTDSVLFGISQSQHPLMFVPTLAPDFPCWVTYFKPNSNLLLNITKFLPLRLPQMSRWLADCILFLLALDQLNSLQATPWGLLFRVRGIPSAAFAQEYLPPDPNPIVTEKTAILWVLSSITDCLCSG